MRKWQIHNESTRGDRIRTAGSVVALLLLLSGLAVAAAGDAATRIEDADSDFYVMGEYLGQVATSSQRQRPLGLQVIALGDGQFRAVLLEGGLPGNGWDRTSRVELSGSRDGDATTLSNETIQAVIQGNAAEISVADRGVIGTLAKVNRRSALLGLQPPAYSISLFDGADTRAFKNARVKDGLLQVGTELLPTYRNFQLHVEFLVPYMPQARGQGRGNSGVYLQSRYEVQILDSFGLTGEPNECGGLYRQRAPDLNMAFPPLSWQTYDITFRAPKFNHRGEKVCDAQLTVLHNGVPVHDNIAVANKTGAGKPEGPVPLPIKFQNHSNPVQFRNIWLVELP